MTDPGPPTAEPLPPPPDPVNTYVWVGDEWCYVDSDGGDL